jgi:DNA-binding XRE family transcriptional regulator
MRYFAVMNSGRLKNSTGYLLNAEKIESRRKELNITRNVLASSLGVNESTLWRWLNGRVRTNFCIASGISVLLKLPLEEVTGEAMCCPLCGADRLKAAG